MGLNLVLFFCLNFVGIMASPNQSKASSEKMQIVAYPPEIQIRSIISTLSQLDRLTKST